MSILSETTISLQDAAASLPSGMNRGQPICFSTVWRWVLKGVRAIDGRRVRLEGIRLGGRWLTSREALERFAAELTQAVPDADAEPTRTPTRRKRDVSGARRKLERMGI